MVDGTVTGSGRVQLSDSSIPTYSKTLVMKDFTNKASFLLVNRNEGYEEASLFDNSFSIDANPGNETNGTVHIFSLATGHAYERLLKIMMLSVTKRTSSPVKFWLFENVSQCLCFDQVIHTITVALLTLDLFSFSLPHSRSLPSSWQSALDARWNS